MEEQERIIARWSKEGPPPRTPQTFADGVALKLRLLGLLRESERITGRIGSEPGEVVLCIPRADLADSVRAVWLDVAPITVTLMIENA